MFFLDFLKEFTKKAALYMGCWTGLMRFRVHALLASHQIALALPKNIYSPTWPVAKCGSILLRIVAIVITPQK
jgi:hypothetical protein